MKVGILRFQGDVAEHMAYFQAAGAKPILIVKPEELETVDAIVIPGGESTTIGRFLFSEGFAAAIQKMVEAGKGVFGTCAGLILLAKEVAGKEVKTLNLLDIAVMRNAYGRQKDSFEAPVYLSFDPKKEFNGIFIRAPKIIRVGRDVEVVANLEGEPVMVRQGKILAATFHPELTEDLRVAEYFLREVCGGNL